MGNSNALLSNSEKGAELQNCAVVQKATTQWSKILGKEVVSQ